jgi:acetyl-CoA carboxylase biotin carboxyl carrier protein
VSINIGELQELIGTISQSNIGELTLKTDEFELMIRKEAPVPPVAPLAIAPVSLPLAVPEALPVSAATPVASEPAPSTSVAVPTIDKKWVAVTSPMVGTFYSAPAPDEPPFVDVGERIRTGQTVCIIEAMKLMNEIESEVAGQVAEIAVKNGDPVEYGQTLLWIDPS